MLPILCLEPNPDIALKLLDIKLPNMSGMDVVCVHCCDSQIPIIIVSAKTADMDCILR